MLDVYRMIGGSPPLGSSASDSDIQQSVIPALNQAFRSGRLVFTQESGGGGGGGSTGGGDAVSLLSQRFTKGDSPSTSPRSGSSGGSSSDSPGRGSGGSTPKSTPDTTDKDQPPTCSISIVSIKPDLDDPLSSEYKGGGKEIFVKSLGSNKVKFQYEVKEHTQTVTMWIEYDPGNAVHSSFYGGYAGKGVAPPKVAKLVMGESRDPGKHVAEWDGRDDTDDHRILLEGTYKVKIEGVDSHGKKTDETTIKMPRVGAFNYGIFYFGENKTKKETDNATARQKSLTDGTAYTSTAKYDDNGANALSAWQDCGVAYWSGHANAHTIFFESVAGANVVPKPGDKTFLTDLDFPKKSPSDLSNSSSLRGQDPACFRDLLLLVLNGCNTANFTQTLQERLKSISKQLFPGPIDGKHGPKTTAALKFWQEWEGIGLANGQKNPETLSVMKIDPSLSEEDQTKAVQTKLKTLSKSYDPGTVDGKMGQHTQDAIAAYQAEHNISPSGLPDWDTLRSLRLEGGEGDGGHVATDFGQECLNRGLNIVVGFQHKVSFRSAEKWGIAYWDQLATGVGIEDAAAAAKSLVGVPLNKDLDYLVRGREGVDTNCTVHPARYGRDL